MSINRRILQGLGWPDVGDVYREENWPPMTCPDPSPGQASTTGLVGLVDAYTRVKSGAVWQWQFPSTLTDNGYLDATRNWCARFRGNQIIPNEQWLNVVLIGYHVVPGTLTTDLANQGPVPYPPTPVTLTEGVGVEIPAGSGNAYTVSAVIIPHGTRCAEGAQSDATGGEITYSTVTDDLVVADSFAFGFAGGQVAGSFTAPLCVQCDPRPSKSTCLSG